MRFAIEARRSSTSRSCSSPSLAPATAAAADLDSGVQ
jgi:hypothetical protein